MSQLAKNFFSWSKKERIGIIALSIILTILFALEFSYNQWAPTNNNKLSADSLKYHIQLLDSLENSKTQLSIPKIGINKSKKIFSPKTKIEYHSFDPNKINEKKWIDFGFSQKQASIIIKYKHSIGGFKTKQDVSSCYVISDDKMKLLSPFIKIKPTKEKPNTVDENTIKNPISNEKNSVSNSKMIVELNNADSIQLLMIKGIGPYFANKILEYRSKLGGYYSKEQLLEIWNFDSLRFLSIKDEIRIDSINVFKLNINDADVNTLKSHPYMKWNIANSIVKYRDQHGDYKTIGDLKKIVLISDSTYIRIRPYLTIE